MSPKQPIGITRIIASAIFLLYAATLPAIETVAITEYMNDTNGASSTDEWVELYNYGETPVNLTGWSMQDDDNDNAAIPAGAQIDAHDFLILARDKASFENLWLDGETTAAVVQYVNGGFAMNDKGADELVLVNDNSQTVWRLAYGSGSYSSQATFYALDDLAVNNSNHGTKSQPINRDGADPFTGALGYEGNEFTVDPWAFAGGGDFGSPLRGAYAGAQNPAPQPLSWTLDVSIPGSPISQGVRGLAIADQSLDRGDNSDVTGIQPCLNIAEGSSIRGVAGGLYADMYDWKRRNDMPRPPTLEFLRWARDHNETLYITANIRGLTIPIPTQPGYREYYTTDTTTLSNLAADWVRYTNHIVQTYDQSSTITDSRDLAILNSLTWSSDYVNGFGTADDFTTLPAVGEAAIPPVTYWEIGNEPTVSLNHAYSVTNGFTFTNDPGEYRDRYIAITTAMRAEDPTIKVGPCIVNARNGNNAQILTTLLQSAAHIDFISYHPYGSMGDWPLDAQRQQAYLGVVYSEQWNFLQQIKDLVALYRPADAAAMQYVASETNVSDFPSNNTFQEGCMAHALGSVETVMSFARLGLKAAHYWVWITATPTYLSDNNRFIVTMAFEKLRDELGDELVGAFDANDRIHIYVIRDSATGTIKIWAMNFSNSTDYNFNLNLLNGPDAVNAAVSKTVLQAITGPTNLFSANLNPEINFGVPRRDVDWTAPESLPGVDPANMSLTLKAATLSLFTIETNNSKVPGWSLY